MDEPGTRVGDFLLVLGFQGTDVFTYSEVGAVNEEVHIGTNAVTLVQGLLFDKISLTYQLNSALEIATSAADPNDLQPITSTPNSLLPIFGAPEMNQFSPGIVYVVPEPSVLLSWVPLAFGWVMLRRRRD